MAAEFDLDKPTSQTGTITKIDWQNPHCWIYIDVKQPDGKAVGWTLETGGPTGLIRRPLRLLSPGHPERRRPAAWISHSGS